MKRLLAILISVIFALSSLSVLAFADVNDASTNETQQEIDAEELQSNNDMSTSTDDKTETEAESSDSGKNVHRYSFTFDYSFAESHYNWAYKDYLGLDEGSDVGEYTGKLTERDYIENVIIEPNSSAYPISWFFSDETIKRLDYTEPQNSNPSVFGRCLMEGDEVYFSVNGVGSTILTYNLNNETYIFDITVDQSYFDFFNEKQIKFARASFYYGESYIKGFASNMEVTAYIGGKKYRTIKTDELGDYSISVKGKTIKVGQSIKVVFTRGSYSKTQTIKVKSNTKAWASTLYYGSKKITIKANNLHKGDKIKVKIGKKTYTYKIKKDYKSYKSTKKIKKHLTKYGNKYTIKVYNKYGQLVSSRSQRMYYAKKFKKGMTKKQVKNTVNYINDWGSPDHVRVIGKYTWWEWDYDDSWICFYKGKVKGWYL